MNLIQKMFRHRGASLLFAIVTLAAGCASTDSETKASEPRRLRSYRTFAIMAEPSSGPVSDPGAVARLAKPMLDSVTSALLVKGYTEARPSEADLLVKIRAEFKPDTLSETTEQRAMIIDMVDRKTGDRIWTGRRDRSSSATLSPELVQKTIADMLAPFPNAAPPSEL